jgi:hypothetical protein
MHELRWGKVCGGRRRWLCPGISDLPYMSTLREKGPLPVEYRWDGIAQGRNKCDQNCICSGQASHQDGACCRPAGDCHQVGEPVPSESPAGLSMPGISCRISDNGNTDLVILPMSGGVRVRGPDLSSISTHTYHPLSRNRATLPAFAQTYSGAALDCCFGSAQLEGFRMRMTAVCREASHRLRMRAMYVL